jgi:hypothetical protein
MTPLPRVEWTAGRTALVVFIPAKWHRECSRYDRPCTILGYPVVYVEENS